MSEVQPAFRDRTRGTIALSYGLVCHVSFLLGVMTMMTAMFFGMYSNAAPEDALSTLKHIWLFFSVPPVLALLLAFRYSKGLGVRTVSTAPPSPTGASAAPAPT